MKIYIKNLQKKIPIPRGQILKAAQAAFSKFGPAVSGLSIVFVGSRRMRTLNKKYLDHDYITDVLAFNLGGGCGEIVICPQAAKANAAFHKTSTKKEIILYVIHGILHLQGFTDYDSKDTIQMRRMENKLLETLLSS